MNKAVANVIDAKVLAVVKRRPDQRLAIIRYSCGMDAITCQTALRRLTRQGKLTREYHSRGNFRWYTYRLAE